jgi:ABC-2 type transport system ATP-binding protein
MAFITVDHVKKDFKIAKPKPGFWGSVQSLFHREYEVKHAVQDISFSVEKGEVIGYIGPNGAGKSTTIKMLTGILTPDAGTISVNGIIPYHQRKENARQIGVVFGQRSQLYWDLPISDTFELYQKLYEIDDQTYRKNRSYFIEQLEMEDFISQPVRQLSLGQKMKANLALCMLHNPDILYLDEPTIGLDVMSKRALRESILRFNRERNTTILLTTHDMDDIESVCERLILIDHGQKLYDGALDQFKKQYQDGFFIRLECENEANWQEDSRFSLVRSENGVWEIKVQNGMSSKEALMILIDRYQPDNISVKEENIEDIIQQIFRS